ncbi:FecR family protein [Spirosoma validum]|uniref:FecR domain-containing protein n=1 Tax=Spirosoma validum TaxID=2771355 RepID=A0A927GCG1_9BACT|nr:FecR family protein [Spirosoma validum]MBD2752485.1 FecR domain-containing protein [Spirosoma validum]
MPDYTKYTFDDFVLDSRFRQWVLTNSPAEQAFWNQWLQTNPDKVDMVLAARHYVTQLQQAQEELSDEELATEVSRIRINRQKAQDLNELELVPEWQPRPSRFSGWLRIAAAVLLVGFGTLAFFYWRTPDTPIAVYQQVIEKKVGTLQEVRNSTNASQLVRLPDGSKVTLYRGSQISFPRTFTARQREVFLVGEAFFEVIRRPKQPFMVYTNQLTTQVLGTSFTVRAYPNDKEAKVIVRTGKVSVFKTPLTGNLGNVAPNEPALILTPNQQVTFQAKDQQLERSLVAMPEPVATLPGQPQSLMFEHTPVVTVFKKLEATYGIVINYDTDLLAGCELTAEFGAESLFEKLDLICRATDSHYEVIDAQIVVYSKGCR